MFGLIEKVAKATVGVALLPVSVAVDAVSLPSIVDEDDSATVATLKSVAKNVTDVATGNWDTDDNI